MLIVKKYISSEQKNTERKQYSLRLGNVSKDFTANNTETPGLNGYMYDFSVDYNITDISNITNIHKYLMKKHDIK